MQPQHAADNLFLLVLPEVSVHLTVMSVTGLVLIVKALLHHLEMLISNLYSLFPCVAQSLQFQRELAFLLIVELRDLLNCSRLVQHQEDRLRLLFVKWIILKAIIACLGLLLLAFLAQASILGKVVRLTIT